MTWKRRLRNSYSPSHPIKTLQGIRLIMLASSKGSEEGTLHTRHCYAVETLAIGQ